MNRNKLSPFSWCTGLLLLVFASSAHAQIFNFTFTSSGMNATGMIDVVSGVAQSGTINVTGVPVEADPSMLITAAGSLLPGSGAVENHNGDVLTYDNLVSFSSDPILTGNGLVFVAGQYGPTHYNTLIGLNGGDAYGNLSPGEYTLFVGEALLDGSGNVIAPEYVYHWDTAFGSLSLTAIPEPAAYAAVFGLAALVFVVIRRRKIVTT
ncbi:MAG TPA: PEP-CTERM sorting domain-containing protein [Opitutaceae bacterium]|nr:PEP-CTERM sorting domain-containing protein [Opitutaceae bacterium]